MAAKHPNEPSGSPTFENPVIPGFHPDPSLCRVGADFYLATSSFEYFPGVPLHHSRDLVHWRPIGHALTRVSQLPLEGVRSSGGIFAPTLRHHDGTFYLVTTLVDRGNFVVTATDPAGPWSEPMWLDEDGIDPSLAFLDGRVYYTRNGPGADRDHPFIYQGELTRDSTGSLILEGPPVVIWEGTGGIWPEAPHLFKRGESYFLLTAEGGTKSGHSIVVARSSDPYGPFVASPHGPLLTHRDAPDEPIQATGHADLVELPDGTTWAVLLGVRQVDGHDHLGRETFLTRVQWGADGWPSLGSQGRLRLVEEAPRLELEVGVPSARDDFSSQTLGPEWAFLRNPDPTSWSVTNRAGHLRLRGHATSLDEVGSPVLVCRPQPGLEAIARTVVDFDPVAIGDEAGLCVRVSEEFHVELGVVRSEEGRELRLVSTAGGVRKLVGRSPLPAGQVLLQLDADSRRYRFSGGVDGAQPVGSVPTRLFSTQTVEQQTGRNHFTGVMLGLYAIGRGAGVTPPADFDWFELIANR